MSQNSRSATKGGNADSIKFLGTAGARFVMINQVRFSAGIWLCLKGQNIILDPGPGALLRCARSRPRLDVTSLDACILTHRHLDHCSDINAMIEAMSEGGFKKRGNLFCPADCLEGDPVVLRYLRDFPEEIVVFEEKGWYHVGPLSFTTPVKNLHSVETFGIVFELDRLRLAIVSDTGFFDGLAQAYASDVLVVNVVFWEKRAQYQHLCVDEARRLIETVRPKVAVITHFGSTVLRHDPRQIASSIQEATGVHTIAAYDGMRLDLDQV